MKIAIAEIVDRGHYTLVESLLRIVCANPAHTVELIVREEGAEVLRHVVTEPVLASQVSVRVIPDDRSIAYNLRAGATGADRIYLCTLDSRFSEVLASELTAPLHLFIHNVDEWFGRNPMKSFVRVISRAWNVQHFLYALKTEFVHPRLRRRVLSLVDATGGRFAVLSQNVKAELSRFTDAARIDIIPFSVFADRPRPPRTDRKIRVCVPGLVSVVRRNYRAVIDMIRSDLPFFREHYVFDFLGGIVVSEGGREIVSECRALTMEGMDMRFYDKLFVPFDEFDDQLNRADLILGNIRTVVDRFSRYGRTKETGLPFMMIRAAKPGLIIQDYELPEELRSSTIRFRDYAHLRDILVDLIGTPQRLHDLESRAQTNATAFAPERICAQLFRP